MSDSSNQPGLVSGHAQFAKGAAVVRPPSFPRVLLPISRISTDPRTQD